MKCIFCNTDETEIWNDFYHCPVCEGIFLKPTQHLTPIAQKKRYELHHNELISPDGNNAQNGYRPFLQNFITLVFNSLPHKVNTLLDYGSGPFPALSVILRELYADNTLEIRSWDPFFAPDTPFFSSGADLVCCLEVAEHFENPQTDFDRLASSCKTNGFIAIGTMLHSNYQADFMQWWYKNDATHVSFYTLKTLTMLANRYGLKYRCSASDRIFLFEKITTRANGSTYA